MPKKSKKGMTSIIIPIANNDYPLAHYTGFCIGNIKEYTDAKKDPYEIIVVDNASTIELGGWQWDKAVDKYERNTTNKGFAAGLNQGYRMSEGDYICFLSNDVFVFKHWLSDLKDALQYCDAVNAYPMYDCPWGRAIEANDRREKWMYEPESKYLTDFLDFSCVLTTRKILEEIGLLDETFGYGYSEDVDWRFRLEEKGYSVMGNKRVNTIHIGGATRHVMEGGGVDFGELMNKNKAYLKNKWDMDKYGLPKFRRDMIKKVKNEGR